MTKCDSARCIESRIATVGANASDQSKIQAPPEQPSRHDLPHVPQLRASRSVLTHTPLHSVSPALQLITQLPLPQLAEPFAGAVQARLQLPQCATFERVSTHAPPHKVVEP